MTRRVRRGRWLLAGALVLTLTSCAPVVAQPADGPPQSGATFADYLELVDASEAVLADARAFIPVAAIVQSVPTVTDLDVDRHRMVCSDTTSQYTSMVRYYLTADTDEIAIIETLSATYEDQGWDRVNHSDESDSVEELRVPGYIQSLRSPDKFGLSVSRGEGREGETILQMRVYSPCIGDPIDRSYAWGKRSLSPT